MINLRKSHDCKKSHHVTVDMKSSFGLILITLNENRNQNGKKKSACKRGYGNIYSARLRGSTVVGVGTDVHGVEYI